MTHQFKRFLPFAFILIATIAVYAAGLQGQFIYWDDDLHVTSNTLLKSGDPSAFWEKPYSGLYVPVIYTVWGFIFQIFDADPLPYKALNLFLHLFNTVLVFGLMDRIFKGKNRTLSLAVVMIFALHPLQVATVSWISAGRDLMAATFGLLALHAYFSNRNWIHYGLSTVLFILGVLCKPSIVTFPIALMAFELWAYRKLSFQKAFLLAVWIMPTLPIIWMTKQAQDVSEIIQLDWTSKVLIVFDTYGFYIQKFLWPFSLSADYATPPKTVLQNLSSNWLPVSLTAISLLSLFALKKYKILFAIIVYFLILLPVSGVVAFSFQVFSTVSDHYIYLALIPLALLLVQALTHLTARASSQYFFPMICVSLGIALSWLSYQRTQVWNDNKVFLNSIIESHPNSFRAHLNLGKIFLEENNHQQALLHIFKADSIFPNTFMAFGNKLNAIHRYGMHAEVVKENWRLDTEDFRKAGELYPTNLADIYTTMAISLSAQGRTQEAFDRICKAVRILPDDPLIQKNYLILESSLKASGLSANCSEQTSSQTK